jgi:hypothetical protein
MGDLTQAMAHIVGLAEEYFDYPLHIAVESADGQGMTYVIAAKGETPKLSNDTLDRGSSFLQFPLTFAVWEQDAVTGKPKRQAIYVEIAKKKGDSTG